MRSSRRDGSARPHELRGSNVEVTPGGWNCPIPRGGDRAGRGIRRTGPLRRSRRSPPPSVGGPRARRGTRGSPGGSNARSPTRASRTAATGRAPGGIRRGSTRTPRRRRARRRRGAPTRSCTADGRAPRSAGAPGAIRRRRRGGPRRGPRARRADRPGGRSREGRRGAARWVDRSSSVLVLLRSGPDRPRSAATESVRAVRGLAHGRTVLGRLRPGGPPEPSPGVPGTIRFVTTAPPAPSPDATETPDETAAPTAPAPPKPTTLVLVRHAVTPQTGPMLSGRTPGIDLSELGHEQAAN